MEKIEQEVVIKTAEEGLVLGSTENALGLAAAKGESVISNVADRHRQGRKEDAHVGGSLLCTGMCRLLGLSTSRPCSTRPCRLRAKSPRT